MKARKRKTEQKKEKVNKENEKVYCLKNQYMYAFSLEKKRMRKLTKKMRNFIARKFNIRLLFHKLSKVKMYDFHFQ